MSDWLDRWSRWRGAWCIVLSRTLPSVPAIQDGREERQDQGEGGEQQEPLRPPPILLRFSCGLLSIRLRLLPGQFPVLFPLLTYQFAARFFLGFVRTALRCSVLEYFRRLQGHFRCVRIIETGYGGTPLSHQSGYLPLSAWRRAQAIPHVSVTGEPADSSVIWHHAFRQSVPCSGVHNSGVQLFAFIARCQRNEEVAVQTASLGEVRATLTHRPDYSRLMTGEQGRGPGSHRRERQPELASSRR